MVGPTKLSQQYVQNVSLQYLPQTRWATALDRYLSQKVLLEKSILNCNKWRHHWGQVLPISLKIYYTDMDWKSNEFWSLFTVAIKPTWSVLKIKKNMLLIVHKSDNATSLSPVLIYSLNDALPNSNRIRKEDYCWLSNLVTLTLTPQLL